MAGPFSFRYQRVLGTDLHLMVGCDTVELAEQVQGRVLDEIVRLEAVLSTYRDDSALSRWMRAEAEEGPPAELTVVLELAQRWFRASEGALHPGLGPVRARWRQAERDRRPPSRTECRELAAEVAELPFRVERTDDALRVHRLGDCSGLDLDALAKGWVVDQAAAVGLAPGVSWLLVNIGGDLRLSGDGSVRVAVEDPASTVDNAPPLAVLTMVPGGLASSGPARRGFQVADRWYGHVLDPRTGWPVETPTGVTVIAPDTVTADALATVVGVEGLDHPTVTALLEETRGAALVRTAEGTVRLSPRWREQVSFELSASG